MGYDNSRSRFQAHGAHQLFVGGLVLGLDVQPSSNSAPPATEAASTSTAVHKYRLVVRERPGDTHYFPGFSYDLSGGDRAERGNRPKLGSVALRSLCITFAKYGFIKGLGIYAKYVLPRLIDLSMSNKDAARIRAEWVPHARGDVLEVGIGSGLNLSFYSSEVRRVYGVDPSPELQKMARKRMASKTINVEFLSQSAERDLPLPDKSIDTVVTTWTLCSIPDPREALRQVKRVMKADGRLIFIEHGRAPDAGVAAWQDRLNPIWKRIAGGCHLNREIDALLVGSGFTIDELRTAYLPGPQPMTYTYQGFAHV